jgi:cytochrome c
MEVGPDGKLYLLEYGNGWFTKNPDAGLARIDYNGGNRPPVISDIQVDKTSGVLPFTVKLSAVAKDLEKDKTTYTWHLGDGTSKETDTPELSYTFKTSGDYRVFVEVKDDKGAASKSNTLNIYAGNEAPAVTVTLTGGNKSFYLPGIPLQYSVSVIDKTDTAAIDPANLFVSVDYVEGFDKAGSKMGHQQGQANISGKNLMMSLDCKACHKEEEKSVGPAYRQVSEKYASNPDAMTYLTQKIIKGGSGVWGEVAMAAHPTLPVEDVHQIVTWILSLSNKAAVKKSLPAAGTIIPPTDVKPNSVLVLSASYTDKGGNNIKALTGSNAVSLPGNTISFTGEEKKSGFGFMKYNGMNIMLFPDAAGWFATQPVDLTAVRSVNLTCGWQDAPAVGFSIEARLDAPDGKVVGTGSLSKPAKGQKGGLVHIPIQAVEDGKFHAVYFVYKSPVKISGGMMNVQFNAK